MIIQIIDMNVNMNNKRSVFLIGDEGINKEYFYSILGIPKQQQYSEELFLSISSYLSQKQPLQIYDFPENRSLKSYCLLYLNILEKPDLIIYFIGVQTKKTEIVQWINMFSDNFLNRVVFFSDARTYWERQQIIIKLSPLFQSDIIEHIYFPNIDQASVSTCLCNLGQVGIHLQSYVRTISTISNVKWKIKRMINYFRKDQQDSVI